MGLGIQYGSTEIDFWSYGNGLGKGDFNLKTGPSVFHDDGPESKDFFLKRLDSNP